jgi:hypothetical protein
MRKSELGYAVVFLAITIGLVTGVVPGGSTVSSVVNALEPVLHDTAVSLGITQEGVKVITEEVAVQTEVDEPDEEPVVELSWKERDGIMPGTGDIEMIRGTSRSYGQQRSY